MTPEHTQGKAGRFIRKTEIVVLTLCVIVTAMLYQWGVAGAQTDPDYWQSYLDTQVSGINITPTPGACGTGTIALQWGNISQVDGYRIARDGSEVIYEGASPTFTDTGLSSGSTHKYYFTAYKGNTTSNTTKMVSASAPGNCVQAAPAAPSNLTATFNSSAGGIILNWSPSSTNSSFNVLRRTGGGNFAQVGSLTGTQSTYTDTASLSAGTTYEYQVVACANSGCSGPSNTASAITPAAATQTTSTTTTTTTTGTTAAQSPQARNLSGAFDSSRGIVLHWSADSGVTAFAVFRRSLGTDFSAISTSGNSSMTYIDQQIAPGMTYEYQVRACVSGTCTTPSNIVSVSVPAPPQNTQTTQPNTGTANTGTQTTVATQPTSTAAAPQPTAAITQPVTQPLTTQTQPTTQTVEHTVTTQPVQTFLAPQTTPTSARVEESEKPAQQKPTQQNIPKTVPIQPSSALVEPVVSAPQQKESAPVTPEQAQFVATLQSIADSVSASQSAVDSARTALIASIDEHINAVLRATPTGGTQPNEKTIQAIRSQLINSIDLTFAQGTMPTGADETRLQAAIKEGFAAIDKAASVDSTVPSGTQQTVIVAVGVFADAIEQATKSLQDAGAGDVYKDSNKDGISDYDSVHIYNIDPIKPTPVTVVDGKKLTAGDKVLLGYDPTAKDLVALPREEPEVSVAPETTVYKVEEIKLTEKKQVTIAGTALPNSFVTLYIYSTPIVVTVKTDRNGKWNYTMDRELETGEHKIYAASVDNTGKIVAKTVAIPFTKTAEAATLDNIPSLGAASVEKPSIANNRAVYPLIALSLLFVFGVLYLMGKDYLPKAPPPNAA